MIAPSYKIPLLVRNVQKAIMKELAYSYMYKVFQSPKVSSKILTSEEN
jgi:hypothetical protein